MTRRYQVIPRDSAMRVGDRLTGMEEHGVATYDEALDLIGRVRDRFVALYGPGCPANDVIEVETVRETDRRHQTIEMVCTARWSP